MNIFVSHSSSDKEFTHELAWDLQQFGVSVWYDDWEIKVGDSIVEGFILYFPLTDRAE